MKKKVQKIRAKNINAKKNQTKQLDNIRQKIDGLKNRKKRIDYKKKYLEEAIENHSNMVISCQYLSEIAKSKAELAKIKLKGFSEHYNKLYKKET